MTREWEYRAISREDLVENRLAGQLDDVLWGLTDSPIWNSLFITYFYRKYHSYKANIHRRQNRITIIRTLGYNFFPDILLNPLKSILVIYCCINYVKFCGLNNRHLLSHCLCESLKGFCRVGLQLMKTWLGLENLLPSWLTHMAVGRKSLFLAIWASPQCFLHDMAVGFPQSEWSQKEKDTSEFWWKKGRDARLKIRFSKFWSLVPHCHSRC